MTSQGRALDEGLALDLSEMARELQSASDMTSVMQRIVTTAADTVPGATGAAITLVQKGTASSPAHSDGRARLVGQLQVTYQEGPCVDTARKEMTLRCDDLRTETRWPRWAAGAVSHGVHSAMSFQLFVASDSMGALDVYGDAVGAFDAEAENVALLLASHAAIAMADSRQIDNLQVALSTRDAIGQAKGILMERYKISATAAFDLLTYASQRLNRKLHELARELAETGEMPTRPASPRAHRR